MHLHASTCSRLGFMREYVVPNDPHFMIGSLVRVVRKRLLPVTSWTHDTHQHHISLSCRKQSLLSLLQSLFHATLIKIRKKYLNTYSLKSHLFSHPICLHRCRKSLGTTSRTTSQSPTSLVRVRCLSRRFPTVFTNLHWLEQCGQ